MFGSKKRREKRENAKKEKVGVIRLKGEIISVKNRPEAINLANYEGIIKKTFELENLKAVALAISSPGGSPVQSELVYECIRYYADKKGIQVLTFIEEVGASGGYWLACAGDEIYALESSIIGSIGVVGGGFGFHKLIEKLGIERRIFTQGNNKVMLDPFLPLQEEHMERIGQVQAGIHTAFINLVKKHRSGKLSSDESELFSGAFWTGKPALEHGLVDGIGSMHKVCRERFGDDILFHEEEPASKKKKLWQRLLDVYSPHAFAKAFFDVAEARAAYGRYGL